MKLVDLEQMLCAIVLVGIAKTVLACQAVARFLGLSKKTGGLWRGLFWHSRLCCSFLTPAEGPKRDPDKAKLWSWVGRFPAIAWKNLRRLAMDRARANLPKTDGWFSIIFQLLCKCLFTSGWTCRTTIAAPFRLVLCGVKVWWLMGAVSNFRWRETKHFMPLLILNQRPG